METSTPIDEKHLLQAVLSAYNYHVLGSDDLAYSEITKQQIKEATNADDFLRHYRESLQGFFQGLSLRFENLDYARTKANECFTHFNNCYESLSTQTNCPPDQLKINYIYYTYEKILTKLYIENSNKNADKRDIKKIEGAIKHWVKPTEEINLSQDNFLRFLLLVFSHSVAELTILLKLEPWPKELQQKRGPYGESVKEQLEKLVRVFTFVHLVSKNSHLITDGEVPRDISRLFGVLGYFYRGKTFYLLSDYDQVNFTKAYNDFSAAEKIVNYELEEFSEDTLKDSLGQCFKWYNVAITYGKGEIYQRAFAYNKAFIHFLEGTRTFTRHFQKGIANASYRSLSIAEAEVAQGKIFIELGEFKNAIKFFFKAFRRVFMMVTDYALNKNLKNNYDAITNIIDFLDKSRQNPILQKDILKNLLHNFNPNVFSEASFKKWGLFISDVSTRVGFVLYLLFKNGDEKDLLMIQQWLDISCLLDSNNGLAKFNQILTGHQEKQLDGIRFKNDNSIRKFLTVALETLMEVPINGQNEEKNFFKQSITYSDSLIKKPLEINYYLSPDRKEKENGLLFLKRWSSSSPRVPRPTTFNMRGGGYLLFWNGKGIAIDPGFDFITNLYSEGYSISDIDAIIVTHDHIDHTDDFDAIIALNYQLNRYNESTYLKPKKPNYLSLFLNTGFLEKYIPYLSLGSRSNSAKIGGDDSYIDKIYTLAPHSSFNMLETEFKFKIEVIPAVHKEIVLDKYAIGFKIYLYDNEMKEQFVIGFTSDTAYYPDLERYLSDCDIVVPHLGFVTFRELGQLLSLDIDKIINEASKNNFSDQEEQLRFFSALGFRDVKSWEDLSKKWNARSEASHQGYLRQHLGYTGIRKIWQNMSKSKKKDKLMIISELHEEMGSFRNKLAQTLNEKRKKLPTAPLVLTSDIGLTLQFNGKESSNSKIKIKCNSCSKDNDLASNDTFHPVAETREVCIKGENEGIFYFCKDHAPDNKIFREKMERLDLFE